MRVVVYVGEISAQDPTTIANYAEQLIRAMVRRPGCSVIVLGREHAIQTFAHLEPSSLMDEVLLDDASPSPKLDADFLIQIHPIQPRPLDLPTAVMVHDLNMYDVRSAGDEGLTPATFRIFHKNLIRSAVVVTHSRHVFDRLGELEPQTAGKLHLTVCPSLLDPVKDGDDELEAAGRRFGIDDDRPTIVYPGRLQLHRNHWSLLEVVYQIRRLGDEEPRLICPGASATPLSWAVALKQRVDYLGLAHVMFPGHISPAELAALYRLSSLAVSTSLAESTAFVAQEALRIGTAAACSATPGTLAHLERMNLRIPTFDPYDIDEMSSVIRDAIDRRGEITAGYDEARQTISSWTWEELADDIVSSVESKI